MTIRWLTAMEPVLPKADIKDLRVAAFEGTKNKEMILAK
jgi:hypothetical protein